MSAYCADSLAEGLARSSFAKRPGSRRNKVATLLARLVFWHRRAGQRRALRKLDDHLLKDIGMSRAQAELEAYKPFWR